MHDLLHQSMAIHLFVLIRPQRIGVNAISVITLSNKPVPNPSIILANFNVSS